MLSFRFADIDDAMLYYNWANDVVARENSYHKNGIMYSDHISWFTNKLNSKMCSLYLFLNEENIPLGQVRIEKNEDKYLKEAIISISIDSQYRGKGFGSEMIKKATDDFLDKFMGYQVKAHVFSNNLASKKCFINAGYMLVDENILNNIPSCIFLRTI